jgi:hypothetical protein
LKSPRLQVIKIGDSILPAAQCELCPTLTKIFPPELLESHVAHYHANLAQVVRYRGGRTPGSVNRYKMSSTGVQFKCGIRHARR